MQYTTTDYRLPAEWEPQCAVLLTWPTPHGPWKPCYAKVSQVFAQIASTISHYENVIILCEDADHEQHIHSVLADNDSCFNHVHTHPIRSDDSWARDHGPITVLDQNGTATFLDFTFNGWGGKHPAVQDNAINAQLNQWPRWGKHLYRSIDFVLEGGAIDCNGRGTLLTTSRCLFDTRRNPHRTRTQIADLLRKELAVRHLLWLDHGHLVGDDTDGHIDTLARFFSADGILYTACEDRKDEHYEAFQAMQRQLHQFRTFDQQPFRCVALPFPKPKYNVQGDRLPATYANFLIINQAVLVPLYQDPADELALQIIAQCFPQREIIGIKCLALIEQFGSLHCVTMQIPSSLEIQE